MVAAVRHGASQREVARQYQVSLATVQFWLQRADDQRLDRVDWRDHPSGPHPSPQRTSRQIENLVLRVRQELRDHSVLGEYGAVAIHAELSARRVPEVPSVRTIHRILERRGALDGQHRPRHRPPPRGWYLPAVADGRAELDLFDLVEDLALQDGPLIDVLNVVALQGGLVGSWPLAQSTAKIVRESMLAHWRRWGLPDYAQFDNATLFQGPHQHPDAIGSVIRLCLSLGITPVFVPPRELGFQAAIESYNGRWQAKVWQRFHHASLAALGRRSARYVSAHCQRTVARREDTPERRPFPPTWKVNWQTRPHGTIIFLRRTSERGEVSCLGRTFEVSPTWVHRLVRCQVELDAEVIRFYALRRRAPEQQPLLGEVTYTLPNRRFRE
jgi:hypothetical protein